MTSSVGWQELPLNRIIRMRSGDFISNEDIESEGAHPVYGGNGFRGFTDRFNTAGPIVLVGRQGAHCGNVHVAHGQIWVSEHALRCFPEKALDAKWLAYALQDMNLNQYSVSAAQPGLSVDNLKHLMTTVPPLEIQQRIARFLDEKTARIDALIEKKRALLDRLAEKRQALITRAVTKGLNPDAPMKPSGIDWLGDIPAHWDCCGLGQKIKLQRGVDITKDERVDGPFPVISSGGIDYFHDTALCTGPGVLVGRKGSAGKLHYAETDFWPHDTTLYVREFRENVPRFVWYLLHTLDLTSFDTGSSNPTVNRNRVHPMQTAWPSPREQAEIASQLDVEFEAIGNLNIEIRHSIQKLEEYRSALITAAVTGQIAELR